MILVFKNDKYKEEDITYTDLKKEISTFHKTRYHSPVFKLFLAEYNLDNKRKAYLAKINKKASRLKPTQNDLDVVYTHSDDPEQELYLESIRMKNKYYNKLKYYDHLLSKEYVDQNIHRLSVKYDRINEAMIFNEHSLSGTESEGFIRHKVLKVTKELLPRYLMSFALICLVTAVTIEVREGITISVVFNPI